MRGWAWKKKKPIYIYIWCMKVGKQEGRKGDTVTREGRDFVLILTNHYNWSQRVPRVISLSLIINPLFFFFWLIIIRRKKKARWAKDNSRLSGGFNFLFLFVFLIPLGNLGHFVFIHSSVAWGKPSFISNARPFECPI